MADIFLSYAHEDQASAKRIVDALAREGLDAWWDHDIPPGSTWARVIGERIAGAKVVIAIWSAHSVESNFVQEEAQMALDARKLLPVKVADVEPPVGFRRTHAANLVDWRGQADHRQWRSLVTEVRGRLGTIAAAPTAPITPRAGPPSPWRTNLTPILIGGGALVALGIIGFLLMERLTLQRAASAAAHQQTTITSPAATPATPLDPLAAERQFWASCCDRVDVSEADYRSYLSRYPSGEFARLARSRLTPAPAPRQAAEPAAPIEESRWLMDSSTGGGDRWYFRSDGTVQNQMLLGSVATWRQQGNTIEIVFQGYIVHRGTIRGSRMSGTSFRPDGTVYARFTASRE